MSHFIIRESSVFIFGTPNGQASTQLLQAMQRGLRAVSRPLDGVGRADLGARRRVAVHADHRDGLHRDRPIDVLQVDHGVPAMRVALAARGDARLAADAAVGVEEELEVHPSSPRRMRTAHTLYSGIFETGSCAAIVS